MILEKPKTSKTGRVCMSHPVAFSCDECGKNGKRGFSLLQEQITHRCKSCTIVFYNKNRSPETKAAFIEAAAKIWRGKKRIEVMGPERRELERQGQSRRSSGENNPNFGGKYSRGFADAPLTGPLEERYGKEKADRIRAKMSVSMSGVGNPMYGKPSPKGAGNGISGWFDARLYFRSLLELSFILVCERSGLKISSAEQKKYRVSYNDFKGMERTYTPDFVDERGNLYEIKPKNLLKCANNILKLKAAPNVIFVTDEQLTRPTLNELDMLIGAKRVKIDNGKQSKIDEYRKKQDNAKDLCS